MAKIIFTCYLGNECFEVNLNGEQFDNASTFNDNVKYFEIDDSSVLEIYATNLTDKEIELVPTYLEITTSSGHYDLDDLSQWGVCEAVLYDDDPDSRIFWFSDDCIIEDYEVGISCYYKGDYIGEIYVTNL